MRPAKKKDFLLAAAIVVIAGLVAGCTSAPQLRGNPAEEPTRNDLFSLPGPQQRIAAAVYDFPDLTGQYSETRLGQAHYSRVVTQGGAAVLVRALQDAGGGQWFRVLERKYLDNILTERSIIRETRQAAGIENPNPQPLMFAGVIFLGGIIGYDTNVATGGAGARLLGVGASTEYQEDEVTVYLRAVSSQTGEIWHNVVVSKRIYSMRVQGDVFRYVSTDEILEMEAGYTRNEPRFHALRKAIEKAVFAMVMEGSERNLWSFADPQQGEQAMRQYRNNRDEDAAPPSPPSAREDGEIETPGVLEDDPRRQGRPEGVFDETRADGGAPQ